MRGYADVLNSSTLPANEPEVSHYNMVIEFYDLVLGRAGNAKEPFMFSKAYDWTTGDRKPSVVASMIIASYENEGYNYKSKIAIKNNQATIKMLRTLKPVTKDPIKVVIG
jgi:hypothetical protein